MSAEAVFFYGLAALVVGSAAVVVFARSVIYNAFALLFTFVGVAGFYLLLGADFLAAAQLLIYVGGILILLLFGVMLTRRISSLDIQTEVLQRGPALALGIGLLWLLAFPGIARPAAWPFAFWPLGPGLLWTLPWLVGPTRTLSPTTATIGELFLGRYLLPFEAASMLLLVALMGAALIVRRRKDA